jgi:hypothetical protein
MKRLLYLLILTIACTGITAQEKDKTMPKKFVFASQFFAGLLEGEAGSSFQIQTINGVSYKTWFAGAGTGLDYYSLRSVPVFLSLNKHLKTGHHSYFVQADGGANFAWVDRELSRWSNVISQKFSPGLYWNGSLGFATAFGNKKNSLMVSLGYSYKHLRDTKKLAGNCQNPPCAELTEIYNYHFRRVSLKLGWQFSNL